MRVLFLSMVMSGPIAAQAQAWCAAQARWTYDANNFTSWGYMRFSNVGDTAVAGQACHKVIQEWNRYDFMSSTYEEDTVGQFFTQDLAGLATLWDGTSFDTLFNFNATIGDHWQLPNDGSFPGTATVLVTDTGTSVLDGTSLRWLAVSLDISPQLDTIYERIGGTHLYWIPWQNGIPDLGGALRCYSDTILDYSTGIAPDCDFTTGLSQRSTMYFSGPYPSPGHDRFTLVIPALWSATLFICDTHGRRILTQQRPGPMITVDASTWCSGVYKVLVHNQYGAVQTLTWVKQ